MTESDDSPASVPIRIRKIMAEITGLLDQQDDAHVRNLWKRAWAPAFYKIIEERKDRPKVEIALVGGTGAGKSTLVNGLLKARILPVSNMRACTAAISEIAFAEKEYRARVDFVSRESWHKEIELLLADYRDGKAAEAEGHDGDAIAIPKIAKDKLSAIYGPWESGELPSLDVSAYEEPPEIKSALDSGFQEIATTSLNEFRSRLREYLDSQCRFWPIVKTVKVSGPFPSLECGATLVDLPGINDPNEAREHVTRTYLKQSQFVWIVFNIKRVLTKDLSSLMQSDDFVRQIIMDGRADALTFVGTASDDIDVDSAWEEFGVDEDAPVSKIALARNEAVRREITTQVSEIANRAARNANSPERAEQLKTAFLASRIFTVSARDYLALAGLAKNKPNFIKTSETEIEQLRDHMIRTCGNYGVEAQAAAHHARINQIIQEIKVEVTRGAAVLDQQREMSKTKRKELGEAISRLSSFLDRDLQDCQERFSQELNASHELLAERMKHAIERGRNELEFTVGHWRRVHWATLRAVARRGGRFISPTSGEHDFAADVSKPILNGITFAWTDFFGERLTTLLDKWSIKPLSLIEKHGLEILKALGTINPGAQSAVQADFGSVINTSEKVIREIVGQIRADMNHRINEVRRTLYEQIPQQVAASMKPAFLEAAEESGTGMKQRMIDKVSTHAVRVSQDMFHDMEEHIGQGVRGLTVWLGDKYAKMCETVKRHANIPVQNLLEPQEVSQEDTEKKRAAYQAILQAIQGMPLVDVARSSPGASARRTLAVSKGAA